MKKIAGITLAVAGLVGAVFLLYGGLTSTGNQSDNCWSRYTTEAQAILNCEGEK